MRYICILMAAVAFSGSCAPTKPPTRVTLTPAEQESIRSAAARTLPKGANVAVTTEDRTVVISAHLLEGHQADEGSPYVRGDYGTHSKLEALVRYRSARIIKSVLDESHLPPAAKAVEVNTRHGVRQMDGNTGRAIGDEAMTLYRVSCPIQPSGSRPSGIESIMKTWTVEMNILPQIQISSE